jgi:hypothetical protein
MRAKQQRAILASHRHHSLLLQFGERRGAEKFSEIKQIVSGAHGEIEYRSQNIEVRSQNSGVRIRKPGSCSSQVPIEPGVAKVDAWTEEFRAFAA